MDVDDPVLGMRGVGREIWTGVDVDAYVVDLRARWFDSEAPHVASDQPAGAVGLES